MEQAFGEWGNLEKRGCIKNMIKFSESDWNITIRTWIFNAIGLSETGNHGKVVRIFQSRRKGKKLIPVWKVPELLTAANYWSGFLKHQRAGGYFHPVQAVRHSHFCNKPTSALVGRLKFQCLFLEGGCPRENCYSSLNADKINHPVQDFKQMNRRKIKSFF